MLEKIIAKLQTNKHLILEIKVIPSSIKNEIVNSVENSQQQLLLKIKLQATPEKGRANKELIKFLSKQLNLPQNHIEIISGHTNPHKIIKIHALQ